MKFDILTTFLVDEARAGLWPARNVLLYQTCSFFLIFFRRAFQGLVLIFQKPYPSTPTTPWKLVRLRWRLLRLWSSLAFHATSHPHRHPPFAPKACKRLPQLIFISQNAMFEPGVHLEMSSLNNWSGFFLCSCLAMYVLCKNSQCKVEKSEGWHQVV